MKKANDMRSGAGPEGAATGARTMALPAAALEIPGENGEEAVQPAPGDEVEFTVTGRVISAGDGDVEIAIETVNGQKPEASGEDDDTESAPESAADDNAPGFEAALRRRARAEDLQIS